MTDMSTRSITSGIRARRGHKERSKNFTELEKRTVLELIARHRDVLRQGRSNNATNRSKQLVWGTICEEVNARCGGERPRTPAQVKMWYENYKKKCKMRDSQQLAHSGPDTPGLLDGMLWQSLHPLDVKEEEVDATTSADALSIKEEDFLPVNMSNGRLSSTNDSDDTMGNVLEPQVQILPHSPEHKHTLTHTPRVNTMQAIEQVRSFNILHKLNELSNTPLNLSNLDDGHRNNGHDRPERYDRPESARPESYGRPESARPESHNRVERDDGTVKHDCGSATEEERQYFTTKRQHAIWEHEAKMKILSMELRQKEEMFSLQKQLFLIELRLKMDFLEKANAK